MTDPLGIHEINPLKDERWPAFLAEHKLATLFHSREWLGAVKRTYGYTVSAVTTSRPSQHLTNAVVFCRVQSWLTGRRLVSFPFSDHCAPLVDSEENLVLLLSRLQKECDRKGSAYVEIRSGVGAVAGMRDAATFCLHRIDLHPPLSQLYSVLHESCIRRKIAKAQRESLTYEEGTSEELLSKFYQLMILTRRRHEVLPQPLSWFRNLIACMGDRAKLRLASHEGRPAACILTIRYKNTMTYKYGCSDQRFHKLGPMQMLMWKAIQEDRESGLGEFDMGRTDWDNEGLLRFKDHWGAKRSTLLYSRYQPVRAQKKAISFHFPKRVFDWAPDGFLTAAGTMLYRHIA